MHPLAWRMSDHLVSCFHNKLGYKRELTINTSKSRSMFHIIRTKKMYSCFLFFYIKDQRDYYLHRERTQVDHKPLLLIVLLWKCRMASVISKMGFLFLEQGFPKLLVPICIIISVCSSGTGFYYQVLWRHLSCCLLFCELLHLLSLWDISIYGCWEGGISVKLAWYLSKFCFANFRYTNLFCIYFPNMQTRGLKHGRAIVVSTCAAVASILTGVLAGMLALGERLPSAPKARFLLLLGW